MRGWPGWGVVIGGVIAAIILDLLITHLFPGRAPGEYKSIGAVVFLAIYAALIVGILVVWKRRR